MAPLPDSTDVVVIGAGHNGLVCAAYLAAAGLEVCVLEAREVVGGNTVTEELTLPGFAHDSCSSAHVLIQSNPLLADDELGLLSTYGLRYATTDPAVVLPQDDGGLLVMRPDLAATADELARWSGPDARAFTELIEEWTGGLAAEHGRLELRAAARPGRRCLPGRPGRHRLGRDPPAVRAPGGALVHAVAVAGDHPGPAPTRHRRAARVDRGRPAAVRLGHARSAAPARCRPRSSGSWTRTAARVVTGAPVATVGVRDGRAAEVTTVDGRRIAARRAVVSGAHLARLAGMLADPPADLLAARDGWRPGLSVFAVHAALRPTSTSAAPARSQPGYGSVAGSPTSSTRSGAASRTPATPGCSSSTRPSSTPTGRPAARPRSRSSRSRRTSAPTAGTGPRQNRSTPRR